MRGRLILLCGLPGSGKTTIARQLEAALDAIRFCPDEWMVQLGVDLFDQEARGRIEALQWELAQDLLRRGNVVVIEWGVWSRKERDELRNAARATGAAVELRYLEAPVEVLWERIRDRTEPVALTYEHLVEYTTMFEPPDRDELGLYDAAEPVAGEVAAPWS